MTCLNQHSEVGNEQSFASFVRHGRKNLRLSQEEFADLLDLSVITLRSWEQEKKHAIPNKATQNYIRVALACPEVISKVLGKNLQHAR